MIGLHLAASALMTASATTTALTAPLPAKADVADSVSDWTISGSVRARIEAIDGQFRPIAPERDAMLALRTTVAAEYRKSILRIGGELMDSRAYFQKDSSSAGTTEVNALEPIQAYVGVDLGSSLGAGSNSSVIVGRFTQDIGSRRLVSRQAFRNSTNAYAGVKLNWHNAQHDALVLFWSMPQVRLPLDRASILDNDVEFDRQSTALQLYGASFTKAGVAGGTLEVYAYGFAERDAPSYATRNRRLITPGLRLARAPGPNRFDYDVEGIYQHGRTRSGTSAVDVTDLLVSAYFVHGEVGRSFAGAWKPRIAIQYDRASGDGKDPGTYTRFDTLYGARRFEYGPTSLYGAIGRANLNSPGARLEVAPTKRLDGFIAYRALWLENSSDSFSSTDIRDRSGTSGSFAGHQIEGRVRFWLKPKAVRIESGFAYLAKGAALRNAPNATHDRDSRYVYTDVTFSF